jgi:4-oxalocrotonate tautomerase
MPVIHIEMLKGRTLEQKRAMVEKVTDAVVETAKFPKEAVKIIIREMDTTELADGGVLRSDI